MLNEFVYCPRLAFLEWVEGEFAHNADTVEGSIRHASVDRVGFRNRPRRAERDETSGERAAFPLLQLRSVELSDPALGLVAKIDLVEIDGGRVQPVDLKKGKRPHVERGAYDPERVQVCAQGLLLRAHGYACDSGVLYFAGSNERVQVDFDDELVALTTAQLAELRAAARELTLPPPLDASPKCVRCSLAPICLPDETRFLCGSGQPPRRLLPADEHAYPLYVQQPGALVRKKDETLQVFDGDEKLGEARIREVSQLVLMGRVSATEAVYQELLQRGKPIVHLSSGGWLYGVTQGLPHANVRLRQEQVRAADDPARSLRIARAIVAAKLTNQRIFLRRNAPDGAVDDVLAGIRNAAGAAERATDVDVVRGHEGYGGRLYFSRLAALIRSNREFAERFEAEGRTRRPPRDPVNALLSFAYSALAREWTTVCLSVGFDPFLGFYHAPRYARPSLALDLMEAFRPLCADSAVIRAINNGEIGSADFVERMGSVNLTPAGRRKFLRSFEQRLGHEVTHPVFGYRISYRRVFEVECRLLARHLLGELATFRPMTTR
ncbi:MAG: CRISPR-associated endonuclease Cas4/Cas1 [Proteobacteria bacterium]|nr:MAG: CRISPR-associated endonuclease Cas4/Cas1 [Pseudomonadota bacterium]